MKFLVDTNIWLGLLLDQQRASEVRQLFQKCEGSELAITDFSLYSIGIVTTRLNKEEAFAEFLSDTLKQAGVNLLRLDWTGMKALLDARKQFGMDFDDAYQYATAEKYGLTLLSFDAGFDRTTRGRKTPAAVSV